ncbi:MULTISPECIES: LysR substrate-binding domain-containing protein [Chromobacterium]|uniref:LysR substrate-binding domain-containing protein n=1 Tax=Chromobacterium TaxID=535 RepID=UPI001E4FCA3D|nr:MULTISPECIES: LysR substrate-binding domain-containing protein [Chromobacterium]WON83229.1 LysR family transcriptional regulator [Chromobacterium haemolyticum]
MMKRLPDLEAWAIFAKVAECGSFARAAAELTLSQATVSKAITRLEARMKTMLFHRTSRRITLTEAGHAALERASRILAEGEAVEADIAEQSTSLRGAVRVTAPMSFGLSHLAPLLPEFMARHPDVELDFHFSDEQVDLVAKRLDVALRIASLADSSLLARRLCAVRILLVGSPAYFARYGRPRHPRELAEHRALLYSNAPGGQFWRFRHPDEGEFALEMPSPLRVNNAEALTPALRAGLGLALQPEFLAWQDVQAGELETVMMDWQVDPIALYILTPPGRSRPARVQALIDYLAARLAVAPWARHQPEAKS